MAITEGTFDISAKKKRILKFTKLIETPQLLPNKTHQ
jgi:hypothetical protein